MSTTTCPQRHRRQVLLQDPLDDDTPRWVCEDCGALMDSDNPERVADGAVR